MEFSTEFVEISYGHTYNETLEKVLGEAITFDTPLIGQDVYLTPYWKAYLLRDGTVALFIHKISSDIVRLLADKKSYHKWREFHYDGFPDPETGRRRPLREKDFEFIPIQIGDLDNGYNALE